MCRLILERGLSNVGYFCYVAKENEKKLILIENFSNVIEYTRTCIFPISLSFPTIPSYLLHLFLMKLLLHIIGELNPPKVHYIFN